MDGCDARFLDYLYHYQEDNTNCGILTILRVTTTECDTLRTRNPKTAKRKEACLLAVTDGSVSQYNTEVDFLSKSNNYTRVSDAQAEFYSPSVLEQYIADSDAVLVTIQSRGWTSGISHRASGWAHCNPPGNRTFRSGNMCKNCYHTGQDGRPSHPICDAKLPKDARRIVEKEQRIDYLNFLLRAFNILNGNTYGRPGQMLRDEAQNFSEP